MREEHYIELIGKKLSGSATAEELEEIQNWIDNSIDNKQLFNHYQSIWVDGKKQLTTSDANEVYENIVAQTSLKNTIPIGKGSGNNHNWNWSGFLKIAASLILLISVGFVTYRLMNSNSPLSDKQVVEYISKSNPRGQKSTIVLPDGSKVKLNSESYLEYPSKFENGKREVKLIGEAFFEVEKNPEKPFIVKSGGLVVRVLGTSFNVSADPYNQISSVAVATGKVSVSRVTENGYDSLIATLPPDKMVEVDQETNKYKVFDFDSQKILGWKDGILIFDDEDYTSIIKKLEKWYGVEFIVGEDYKQGSGYTGMFKNATLEKVMDGWSYTSNFEYTIEGKRVLIK